MYTIQIIADKLNRDLITNANIQCGDPISSVRFFSKGKMSEDDIRDCYPEQFEAGKAKYLASLNELKEM